MTELLEAKLIMLIILTDVLETRYLSVPMTSIVIKDGKLKKNDFSATMRNR